MQLISLSNAVEIPIVGLGTWRATGDDVRASVSHALSVGYRHIDTAAAYGNEADVGDAIAKSGIPRNEVFVTTKIWNSVATTKECEKAIDESLSNLKLDHLDLLLIHWPGSYERNAAVYSAMENAVDAGKVRALGISNFHVHHTDALLSSSRIAPVVNQVETHVHLQNTRVQRHMAERQIVLEAYAPLKSSDVADVLGDETLGEIGRAHGKTPAQVCIRWLVQRGVVVLPKSVTPSRIEENFAVFDFELSDEEMSRIRTLNRGRKTFPDPDNVDFGFPLD